MIKVDIWIDYSSEIVVDEKGNKLVKIIRYEEPVSNRDTYIPSRSYSWWISERDLADYMFGGPLPKFDYGSDEEMYKKTMEQFYKENKRGK